MKTTGYVSLLIILVSCSLSAQTQPPRVLLRLDDNGMNHSVNMAIKQVADTGIPFSTSVMFACPWYQQTVALLKNYPNVSVGVHLVLNSEWKYYRWGPVLGRSAVPTLVDADGYFLPSSEEFLKSSYNLEEVEKELSAQLDRAVASGLKIDYVDYHMGTAVSTPELRKIVEKLAARYKVGISRYFGESYKTMFDTSVETKKKEFLQHLANLNTAKTNLVVLHVAQFNPEMKALVDMNNADMRSDSKPLVALHRSTELDMLLSDEFQRLVKQKKIQLVTYKDLVASEGLETMKAPAN